ncbi:MAG: AAA family ATPase [Chloroflexota bacterium]
MKREDLGTREAAKARTLRVLFEFVGLKPEEILELGQDHDLRKGEPNHEQIQVIAEKKREREILLQSASSKLTTEFRSWWQQGSYLFRFQADGDHFRIWVHDTVRPEEVELENRSTGLQWFLSFYLVFLVERSEAHQDSILLLDEPGSSLHPIAQQDLFEFFDELSGQNQIFYTAHSPFMVDPDHLERVRVVYYEEEGKEKGLTKISADLRAREKNATSQTKSIHPVYAALDLNIAPVLLWGGQVVVVEGTSDQYYLSAIKTYLIREGLIAPSKEILFLPSGSYKGIKAALPIITGIDEELPFVILDSDNPGKQIQSSLIGQLYRGNEDRIIMIGDFTELENAEIEDIIPQDIMGFVATRQFRGPSLDFEEVMTSDEPIVNQIEKYAMQHSIDLISGWKVHLAKQVKERIIKLSETPKDDAKVEIWKELFSKISEN